MGQPMLSEQLIDELTALNEQLAQHLAFPKPESEGWRLLVSYTVQSMSDLVDVRDTACN